MKKKTIKYILGINSRVDDSISMEMKHQRVVNFLKQIHGEWGLDSTSEYLEPKFGSDITAHFSLTKKLGKGIKGNIWYRYRRLITDDHSCDDRLWIDFNAKEVSFQDLINSVSIQYIKGFNAYLLWLFPESLIYDSSYNNIPQSLKSRINYRKCLDFFYPFHFMDSILIKNVFGCTSDELFEKLQAAKVLSEKLEGGVYFRAADEIVSLESALSFNNTMQQVLNVSLPIVN